MYQESAKPFPAHEWGRKKKRKNLSFIEKITEMFFLQWPKPGNLCHACVPYCCI